MATGKLNYWLKLRREFLFSETIGFLMSLPNGAKYVVLYWQLCALAINSGGELQTKIGKIKVPYDAEKIRRECKYYTDDEIAEGLQYLEDLGLITKQRNGVYKVLEFDKMVGSESDYAAQKRAQRSRQAADKTVDNPEDKSMDKSVDVPMDNVHTDIRDKILDIRDLDSKRLDNYNSVDGDVHVREVREYLSQRNLLPNRSYTDDAELLELVHAITVEIFKKLGGRQPTFADTTMVQRRICVDELKPVVSVHIDKDRLDLLLYAFEQALYSGCPGNWKYIDGVLGRLAQRKIRTLTEAEEYDEERMGV
ncbi:MAG: phage replisome organizer N-terminal domain-containing protein [Oscillospiraceae bacterium]|nr:phage replisome organizer N-terminal domain-containing protein [Oscillospiraceae bacterium]